MHRASLAGIAAACIVAAVVAACGGGDDEPDLPDIAGTPIPTAVLSPTPAPYCGPEQSLSYPQSFVDAGIPVPELKLESVETTPHLKFVGISDPRIAVDRDERVPPTQFIASLMARGLQRKGWDVRALNVNSTSFEFSMPDGRTGTTVVIDLFECPPNVRVTVETPWITAP